MTKETRKQLFVYVIVLGIICTSLVGFMHYSKAEIHTATIEQLEEVKTIGPIIAEDIYSYLQKHPNCSINDLDEVYNVGCKRIKYIKQKFR